MLLSFTTWEHCLARFLLCKLFFFFFLCALICDWQAASYFYVFIWVETALFKHFSSLPDSVAHSSQQGLSAHIKINTATFFFIVSLFHLFHTRIRIYTYICDMYMHIHVYTLYTHKVKISGETDNMDSFQRKSSFLHNTHSEDFIVKSSYTKLN